MLIERKQDDAIVFDLTGYELEDELPLICDQIKQAFSLKTLEKIEGPGTTIWELNINGHYLALVHNSYGSFLSARNEDSIQFVRENLTTLNRLL